MKCDNLQKSVSKFTPKMFYEINPSGQYFKLFAAVITPLAAYFSMIFTELRR